MDPRDELLKELEERKKAQRELEEAYEKLKLSVAHMIQTEKQTALGELTAGIAHELNQPLNVTKIICQGLLRDIEKGRFSLEEARNDLPEIIVQMNKMAGIISHMRIFTRHTDVALRERCDLNVIVDDILLFISQHYKDHHITLLKKTAPELPFILGDQIQIEHVCMNLLTNARYAVEHSTKSEKRIEIRTLRGPDDTVAIEIADNGIGIADPLKPRIFQQFFTTKEPGKGTGLGLSLSRKIIEEHKGTITFDSTEGDGTTFRIIFPVLKGS